MSCGQSIKYNLLISSQNIYKRPLIPAHICASNLAPLSNCYVMSTPGLHHETFCGIITPVAIIWLGNSMVPSHQIPCTLTWGFLLLILPFHYLQCQNSICPKFRVSVHNEVSTLAHIIYQTLSRSINFFAVFWAMFWSSFGCQEFCPSTCQFRPTHRSYPNTIISMATSPSL